MVSADESDGVDKEVAVAMQLIYCLCFIFCEQGLSTVERVISIDIQLNVVLAIVICPVANVRLCVLHDSVEHNSLVCSDCLTNCNVSIERACCNICRCLVDDKHNLTTVVEQGKVVAVLWQDDLSLLIW